MSGRAPSVSIVIPSRNEGDMLSRTVEAITATVPVGAEIIVADDDSSDGSADAVGNRWPEVRVLRRSPCVGVARARNAGAAVAHGELLVFSDAHVVPTAGWLELMSQEIRRPGVGAVGPTLTHLSGQSGVGRGLTWTNTALNLRWLCRGADHPVQVPMLCGCFMALRREVFERVGGFDESFARYGGEDIELCVRLWRMGFECVVEPRAVVAHRFRRMGSSAAVVEDSIYNLLRIGSLHFSAQKLDALRRTLGRSKAFSVAEIRLSDSDVVERRTALDAAAAVDPDWFFERFQLTFFDTVG